jgi:hypothetical protein
VPHAMLNPFYLILSFSLYFANSTTFSPTSYYFIPFRSKYEGRSYTTELHIAANQVESHTHQL